jgi:uncharacterized protein YkwD
MNMRRICAVIAAVAAAVMTMLPGASAVDATTEDQILALINQGRQQMGLQQLVVHQGLRAVAREHSTNMVRAGYQAHVINGDTLEGRLNRAAPDPVESNGPRDDGFRTGNENICCGYPSPAQQPQGLAPTAGAQAAYDAWFHSPGHYANMFNRDINVAGIGVASFSNGRWFVTFIGAQDTTPPGQVSDEYCALGPAECGRQAHESGQR